MQTIACADIRADVPKIACPTLVITTERSGLASVEKTTAWQRMILLSELVVLPGDSYHATASHPVECARATLAFIAPLRVGAAEAGPALAADFEKRGVEPWARESMGGRLGSDFPPDGVEWWTKFMGQTAPRRGLQDPHFVDAQHDPHLALRTN